MVSTELVLKMMDMIPDSGISVHQLTCKTCLDHRTVRKYLDLITAIQERQKIYKAQVGLRILVKREK